MNKFETWRKYELHELFYDLEQAEQMLSKIKGGHSGIFISAEQFHEALKDEIYDLKHQNVPDFGQICSWFAPTSVWDDFMGKEELELSNRIFDRADNWDKSNL